MPRYNRHLNPAFGVSTSGWTQSGTKAALARSGGGTFSRPGGGVGWLADARSNGSARPAFWTTGSLGLSPVTEGETYTVSIYAYQGSGATRNQRLDVDMVNASGSVARSVAATVAGANNTWHRLSATVTVQPGETHLSTYLIFLVGATAVDNTYVAATQAMIEDGSTLGTYGDGDSQGWQWNGSPGLSMSQEVPEPEAPQPTGFGRGFLPILMME